MMLISWSILSLMQCLKFMGLLAIEWVISVDYPSAHVFSARRRGLARAQGAHPVHGRT
jgi:hypothetical protein